MYNNCFFENWYQRTRDRDFHVIVPERSSTFALRKACFKSCFDTIFNIQYSTYVCGSVFESWRGQAVVNSPCDAVMSNSLSR